MPKTIKCAFIPSAGYGRRLAPLTDTCPKPLVPLGNDTALERIFEKLLRVGVERFVVNIHHLPEVFREFLAKFARSDGRYFYKSAEILPVFESELLDTGGGIKNALPLLESEDAVFVHNGDILFSAAPKRFADFARKAIFEDGRAAVLCLRDGAGNKNVGVCADSVCDMRFALKNKAERNLVFTGFFAAGKKFLEETAAMRGDVFSTVDVLLRLIEKDKNCVAFFEENAGVWSDIGTPAQYLKACGKRPDTRASLTAKLALAGFAPTQTSLINKGASLRKFLRFKDGVSGKKLVACFYGKQKREDALYAKIAAFLKKNSVDVPQTVYADARKRVFVMEDGGSLDLLTLARENPRECKPYYLAAADNARMLHTKATAAFLSKPFELSQPFDAALYDWEQNYFKNECMRSKFGVEPDAELENELLVIKQILLKQPLVLLHRDFQSQNIMIDGGRISLIDFQGMRLGCAFYDLASLIFDPYADLPDGLGGEIVRRYLQRDPTDAENALLYTAACQRLMQALGAYGFLSIKKKMPEYAQYFSPALARLQHCAERAGFKRLLEIAKILAQKAAASGSESK